LMALLLAAGMAGSVNGAVLYYDITPDITVLNPASYLFDPFAGTSSTNAAGIDITPGDYIFNGEGGWEVSTVAGVSANLEPIAESTLINAGTSDWSAGGNTQGLTLNQIAYVGIRYDYGAYYGYGWIQVQRVDDGAPAREGMGLGIKLLSSSFNTEGELTVGQTSEGGGGGSAVPEPGTAAMLGIGVVMLSAARRRFRHDA
jgi:hypothetical protein